jgi:hypothetical protein
MGPQNRLGVKGLVARQYLFLRFMAIALDLPCALALSKFAVPLFLATVTSLACSIPARPIARVDPRQALRYAGHWSSFRKSIFRRPLQDHFILSNIISHNNSHINALMYALSHAW